MITFLAMVAVLASAQNTSTPTVPVFSEPRQISEDAMKLVADNDIKGLFGLIAHHMPMKKADLEKTLENFETQRKALPETTGKLLGYSFISECRRSDLLVRLMYVEKHEKSLVRWQFIFYKPRQTWQLLYFYMDQDPNGLFVPCP